MKNAITTILTDASSRGTVDVEKMLTNHAAVTAPWAD